MKIDTAYNKWAENYDNVENKTRDLEKIATKTCLMGSVYGKIVELGCGTGKNTEWLLDMTDSIIAVDFSEKMLEKAKEKILSDKVLFKFMDLNKAWDIEDDVADLISCSLTLEHISNLDHIFKEAYNKMKDKAKFYVCELHPFKQYSGSKARFDSGEGILELEVFTHHISDYIDSANKSGLKLIELQEWFDFDNKELPRLISFIFEK